MPRVTSHRVTRPEIKLTATLELNEIEIRALDGIFGYDVEAFLKAFYEKMGAAYVKPFEAGVRSLHETMRRELAAPLAAVQKARNELGFALQMYEQALADAAKPSPKPVKKTVRVPAGSTKARPTTHP